MCAKICKDYLHTLGLADMHFFNRLIVLGTVLALGIVMLGAFVRLSDAGLGCPDWPGCYGHMAVPHTDEALNLVQQQYPDRPVIAHKAWKEMVHRYFAGSLGLLILAICIFSWRYGQLRLQSTLLVGVVMMQAALGMWTVTLLLKPVIVTAHLIGGMATLAILAWMTHRQFGRVIARSPQDFSGLRRLARLGLAILVVQIFLGGWTSSNYAALACGDFPTCQGVFFPDMNFIQGFHFIRPLGMTADGGQISGEALTAIHWVHRLGALVTFIFLLLVGIQAIRTNHKVATIGKLLIILLCIQISLGVSNVMFHLPLPVAVAHNGVAALLLITVVVLNSTLTRKSRGESI